MKQKHKGSYAEIKAVAWLMEQGFEVFKNVSTHGEIDIVAIKDGVTRYFDVKFSYRGGSRNRGVEYMSMMADGSFRIMPPSKPRGPIMRELTPREIVERKISELTNRANQ